MTQRLKLRQLVLTAKTDAGSVGRSITFASGLNVLRADNTSGKSTMLQAAIYALGLEGMLSAKREIPLPHSLTHYVEIGGEQQNILTSAVLLELENAAGEIIVVQRTIKNPALSQNLVRVYLGPMLSDPGMYEERDFFVRRPGSAQREAGFHAFLAKFLNWDLPPVTRFDGSESPLYLECIFPYFYVEQKHGWAGVQARIPTYLGIREVAKRSPEFILGLEVYARILLRQRLRSEASQLEADWQTVRSAVTARARLTGALLNDLPSKIAQGSADSNPTVGIYLGDKLVTIDEALSVLRVRLAALEGRDARTVGEASLELEQSLALEELALRRWVAAHSAVMEEEAEYSQRRDQLELRLESLRDDLQRHKDSEVLRRLGSDLDVALLAEDTCPTCHQEVDDGTLTSTHVMTVAGNIKFIQEQVATFTGMYRDSNRILEALGQRRQALAESIRASRRTIRLLRESLSSRESSPAVADIAELVALRDRIERLELSQAELGQNLVRLGEIHSTWIATREEIALLDRDQLSGNDQEKISFMQASLREQLSLYGFKSLSPADVDISAETYRPVHEGFDLGFDLSASDMIRVIWSYLLAVMDTSRHFDGQHAGLLMFDEPRQQEVHHDGYSAFLRHSALLASQGSQVIVATSESEESLIHMLADSPYVLWSLGPGEKVLQAQ